jgi:hypothetical protein
LGANPSALHKLACELKEEGHSQSEVYDLYLHQLRKFIGASHAATYTQISDTMDVIAGHCEKSRWIFKGRL